MLMIQVYVEVRYIWGFEYNLNIPFKKAVS